ncbi:SUF system NifU family Fe-S cluster assembly protein [Candidatus Woesearchaeota archaeon]|nr:SUF system NifU family Fe-S cluster assembly protein [Candidatus Woesearchaeota archaeon]
MILDINPNQVGEGELTEEEQIYKENILDHYKNPHNFGSIDTATFRYKEFNPLCGDQIEIFLELDQSNKVKDVKFKGNGCAISQAAISMLTDSIKNKNIQELKKIKDEDVLTMLGIPIGIVRIKCALLGLKALHKSLEEFSDE